jgi:hypothetical protein
MGKNPARSKLHMDLSILKNAIGSWYHQDAYLDFASDEEIWADIFAGHDPATRSLLAAQLADLLQQGDSAILALWNSEAHSHTFTRGDEARSFLGAMHKFFEGREHGA